MKPGRRMSKKVPTLRERAAARVRATRTDVTGMTPKEVQRLVLELEVHQIELEIQNEELRRAQTELSQSRDRFNDLYDSAPVGYLTLDEEGVVIEANLTVAEMFGIERAKLVGGKFTRFVARTAQDALYLHQRALRDGDKNRTCELLLRRADRTQFFARMETIATAEAITGTRHCRSAIIDITERQQAEAALRASEERYRTLHETMHDAFVSVDMQGRILEFNTAYQEILGYTADELRKRTYVQLTPKKWHAMEARIVAEQILSLGFSRVYEKEYRRKDGTTFPVELRTFLIRNADGQPAAMWAIVRDITERKEAAEMQARFSAELERQVAERTAELRESERRAKAVVDGLSAHIALVDERGRIGEVNERWRKFALENEGTLISVCEGANYLKVCDTAAGKGSAEVAAVAAGIRDVLAGRRRDFAAEYPCHSPREQRWFIVRVTPFPGEGPPRVVVSHENITVRVKAEAELRESERRERERAEELSALLDAVPAAIFLAHDRDCRHMTGNRAADELLQIPRGGEASLSASTKTRPRHFKVLHQGRVLRHDELPAQRAARGTPIADFEETVVFDDGTRREMLAYATPLWNEAGQSRGAILVLIDITARKRAEAALRESEERYRQLVHALPAAVYTVDVQGRITLYNAAAVALWGREPTSRDRWNGTYRLFTPDGKRLPVSQTPIAKSIHLGEPIRGVELIIERSDRSRSHVLAFPEPLHDSSGAVTGAVNILVDITALKVAENALRTSERKLRTLARAVEQSPSSVLITSPSGEIEYVNPTFTEVTGYSLEEVLGKNPRLLKSGQQPPGLYREIWETILAGQDWHSEICNRKKNGELFWSLAVIAPIMDEHGTVTHFVGMMEDITERKRAEKSLTESKQRLAGIVGSAMDAIISVDASQRIVLFNVAAEKMFRCAASEAIGSSLDRFIPQCFRAAHAGHIRSFGEKGATSRAMGRLGNISGLRTDGEEFPIEASISHVEIGGEKIFTVILRDIAERQRLQHDVLEISASEQRRIGQELHDDLCQWLSGTEFLASALAQDLDADSPENAARARKIAGAMRQALARTRTLAHGLAPGVIDAAGFAGALRELALNACEMFGIRCLYEGPETVPLRDTVAALHLYRIAQEAISNAVRHGGAGEIGIFLQSYEDRFAMLIRDDGSGIAQPLPLATGMGLRIMQYRAGIIGATLEIRPGAGGGTEIVCTFPRNL